MNNSELIDHAQSVGYCLSYNDRRTAAAKQVIRQLTHRLGARVVRIHKKKDGYLMITVFGSSRFLTWREAFFWRFFKLPPQGMIVEQLPERLKAATTPATATA